MKLQKRGVTDFRETLRNISDSDAMPDNLMKLPRTEQITVFLIFIFFYL